MFGIGACPSLNRLYRVPGTLNAVNNTREKNAGAIEKEMKN